ncbi:YcxB family protein [Planctomycetota bacterium]
MDKFEFEYKPSLGNCRSFYIKKLLKSKVVQFYYVIIIGTILSIEGIYLVFDMSEYDEQINTIIGSCIWGFLIPLVGFLFLAGYMHVRQKKYGQLVLYLDSNGYGAKGSDFKVFYEWKAFESILETENSFLMKLRKRERCTILKEALSEDIVSSIREMLNIAPVPNKKLLDR